jgi:DNA-binding LacI/PurR family transcriptional regulator/DNA-binding transcriptional regulator YhcF (GntR family)
MQTSRHNPSAIPAYQRIEEDIREKIRDGRLPAGAMLSNRHNLAKEYGVALSTAQRAIANLIADGTLEAQDRRGTFVAHPSGLQEERAVAFFDAPPSPTIGLSAEPAPPPASLRAAGQTSATLGIISTSKIEPANSLDSGSLWARLAIRSLEYVFSAAGGTTHFFDRYPDALGPYDGDVDDAKAIPMCEAIAALRAEGADALAIVGLCEGRDMSDEIVAAVNIEHVPTVYISWHEMRPPLAQVFYDNPFAGYQAAQHLLRKGFRRLAFFAPFTETWLTERIEAARDALRHAGLPPESLRIYPDRPPRRAYDRDQADAWMYALARQAFAEGWFFADVSKADPWGLIAPNDYTAYAIQRAAAEHNKLAGIDYGLIGFDDGPQSSAMRLTTVRPPIEAMGQEAGRLLLRTLQGEEIGSQVRLRSHVIPRASTSLRRRTVARPSGR